MLLPSKVKCVLEGELQHLHASITSCQELLQSDKEPIPALADLMGKKNLGKAEMACVNNNMLPCAAEPQQINWPLYRFSFVCLWAFAIAENLNTLGILLVFFGQYTITIQDIKLTWNTLLRLGWSSTPVGGTVGASVLWFLLYTSPTLSILCWLKNKELVKHILNNVFSKPIQYCTHYKWTNLIRFFN